MRQTTALAFLAFSTLAAAAAPASGAAARLLPHRAVYELTLGKSSGPRAPTAAGGMIAYDFSGSACEGWAMTFRQRTELQPLEGPTRASDMTSTTFEESDGAGFRFRVESRQEGGAPELVDGRAERSAGGLSIALTRPQREKLDLGAEAAFPTEQTLRILAAAREARSTLEMKVYDGTDTGKKIYDTLAVIGQERAAPATEKAAQDAALQGVRRWPVAISYFEEGKSDGEPAYVLSFDLYDNGVSRALKLDYGDFVLHGELTKFEPQPIKPCKK